MIRSNVNVFTNFYILLTIGLSQAEICVMCNVSKDGFSIPHE